MTIDALPPVEIMSSAASCAYGPDGGLAASLLECALACRIDRDASYVAHDEPVGQPTEISAAAERRAIPSFVAVMPRLSARTLLAGLARLFGAGRLVPGR